HPPGPREVLAMLLLRHRHDPRRVVEDEAPRRRRALVNRGYVTPTHSGWHSPTTETGRGSTKESRRAPATRPEPPPLRRPPARSVAGRCRTTARWGRRFPWRRRSPDDDPRSARRSRPNRGTTRPPRWPSRAARSSRALAETGRRR